MDRTEFSKACQEKDPKRRALTLRVLLSEAEDYRNELLEARAAAIRELHAAGRSGTEIVQIVGVSKGRVSQILAINTGTHTLAPPSAPALSASRR